ncbi:MAG TPA: hypothetical protein VIM53_04695 [Candidatus Saccharimonadales bacterium]
MFARPDPDDLVSEYISYTSGDTQLLSLLREQSRVESWESIISRKNFVGHITSSVFVVTPDRRVLLLQHEKLGRLLQPGGHIDGAADSLLTATFTKLRSETGITEDRVSYRPRVPGKEEIPFHIDTHHIPEDVKSGEPAHYHHDFQYLVTTLDERELELNSLPPDSWRWVSWGEFKQLGIFNVQAMKIEQMLGKSPEHFLKAVIGSNKTKVPILMVSHILPSMLAPLRFMQNNFNLVGVIAKPKSIDESIYGQLEAEGIKIIRVQRGDITTEWMNTTLEGHNEVVLSDIGGYFATVATKPEHINAKILGIVEDTENGHQKYERLLKNISIPIYSVARNPLKDNEDYLVGHAVAHATDTILRQTNTLMSFGRCGVIGYGKVGQGVCAYLMSMKVKPVVCEINSERLVRAYNHGCDIGTIDELLKTCDTLFCATGSQSLDIHKFRKIKSGMYVASVTSSDDEFNLEYLKGEYEITESGDPYTKATSQANSFYLLNGGNAVNFLYNASLGDFIYLVQAAIIKSIVNATEPHKQLTKGVIHSLDGNECQEIARLWLEEFPRKR